MRAIVVCSAQGGVGKTTVAVQIARALEGLGERTVLVDLDPVGPATHALAPGAAGPPASSGSSSAPGASGAGEGPSLAAALTGRWSGRAADLVRAGQAGPGVIPAIGLEDVGAVLSARAEGRLRGLVASLMGEEKAVVVDCPAGPVGRVGPFTAVALAAVAPLGGSGGGVLAVMTPSGPQVAGTAELLGRVPPGAVLGLVVNGVGPTRIGASHHDLGRRLGVPVLARVPSVARPESATAVGEVIGGLAELLAGSTGVSAAWRALWAAIDGMAQRDRELLGLVQAELDRVARDPTADLDIEFELALELLRGNPAHDRLVSRCAEVLTMRRAAVGDFPEVTDPLAGPAPPPPPDAELSVHDRLNLLAPWAAEQRRAQGAGDG
jgi:cellulose biosynthesis protein BcsQ